jgi:hypothetical protein
MVFTKLLGLTYKIVYKKGANNIVVDALSRIQLPSSSSSVVCCVVSKCQPQWLGLFNQSYENDDFAKAMLTKVALDNTFVPNFSLVDGLMHYKNRI